MKTLKLIPIIAVMMVTILHNYSYASMDSDVTYQYTKRKIAHDLKMYQSYAHSGYTKSCNYAQDYRTDKIKYPGLTTLPKEIGVLYFCTNLFLCFNSLTTLPKEIANLQNLGFLNIGYNNFVELPEVVLELKSLRHFLIYGNPYVKTGKNLGLIESLEQTEIDVVEKDPCTYTK